MQVLVNGNHGISVTADLEERVKYGRDRTGALMII